MEADKNLVKIHNLLKANQTQKGGDLIDSIDIRDLEKSDLSYYYFLKGWYYHNITDYSHSREFSEKAKKLAIDSLGRLRASFNLFNTDIATGRLSDAEDRLNEILPLINDPNLEKDKKISYKSHLYISMSIVYRDKWNFNEALKYSLKSINFLEELGEDYQRQNFLKFGIQYNNLAYIYYRLDLLEDAKTSIDKAISYYKEVKENTYILFGYFDLIKIALRKGEINAVKTNLEILENLLDDVSEKDFITRINAYVFLVRVYYSLDQFSNATNYMNKAMKIVTSVEDPYIKTITYTDKVFVSCQQGWVYEAEKYLKLLIEIADAQKDKRITHLKNYSEAIVLFYSKKYIESLKLFKNLKTQAEKLHSDLDASIKLYIVEILLELCFNVNYNLDIQKEMESIASIFEELLTSKMFNTEAINDKIIFIRAKIEKFNLNFSKAHQFLTKALELAKKSDHTVFISEIENEIKKIQRLATSNEIVDINLIWESEKQSISDYFKEIQKINISTS